MTIESEITDITDKTFRIDHRVSVGVTLCAVGFERRAWVAQPTAPGERLRARSIPPTCGPSSPGADDARATRAGEVRYSARGGRDAARASMSWIDRDFPKTATPTARVGRVLALNPGLMTGPGTNTYLVGERDPILIDTGAGVPGYVPLLEGYLRSRGWVAAGAHPADPPPPRSHRRRRAPARGFPGLGVAKLRRRNPGLPESIADLADGEPVRGDGATLIALYAPGHASDHLCYYLVEEKALFTGDVVLGGSTTVIPSDDGDLGDSLDSLRRLQQLDISRIYPAHGPAIEDPQAILAEYMAHRLQRERQILDALGSGETTIPGIVRIVYAAVSPALHPVAAMSVESHLRKLERPGAHHSGGSLEMGARGLSRRRDRRDMRMGHPGPEPGGGYGPSGAGGS